MYKLHVVIKFRMINQHFSKLKDYLEVKVVISLFRYDKSLELHINVLSHECLHQTVIHHTIKHTAITKKETELYDALSR